MTFQDYSLSFILISLSFNMYFISPYTFTYFINALILPYALNNVY